VRQQAHTFRGELVALSGEGFQLRNARLALQRTVLTLTQVSEHLLPVVEVTREHTPEDTTDTSSMHVRRTVRAGCRHHWPVCSPSNPGKHSIVLIVVFVLVSLIAAAGVAALAHASRSIR
jgi:hypothetical protein